MQINEDLQNDGKLEASLGKILCEKLNLSFSKYILGVHKKSQNSAVRGELGRLPLGTDIISSVVRYRMKLEFSDKDTILNKAYELSTSMSNSHKKSWGLHTKRIVSFVTKHSQLEEHMLFNKRLLKKFIRSNYSVHWKSSITQESRMRTYNKFKHNFEYEEYLNLANEEHRKSLTRLRISAHRLAIERGRYTVPHTPPEERLCNYCSEKCIEDEFHFLMSCNHYQEIRSSLKMSIIKECKNFANLEENAQFIYMMSSGQEISYHVAKYIHDAFVLRKGGVTF